MTEVVEFELHEHLIYDIIERQAGNLDKGVLEAIMNSVEAGASRIDITFREENGEKKLTIADDGKGIVTRQELDAYFRRFGNPHTADEKKIFARFRVGRGQIFSQGKNRWHTCQFEMSTDYLADKQAGRRPRYTLKEIEFRKGCLIEISLYPTTWTRSIEALQDAIREQIEFISTPVYFNGTLISFDPKRLKWTHEDEDAYYLFGHGMNLLIYNLGARCEVISAAQAGVTGAIVSKKRLEVNFARNQVINTCPVMQRINLVVRKFRAKKTRKPQRRLMEHERIAALLDLCERTQQYDDLKAIGLFNTTNNRILTLHAIRANCLPWTFAEEGNRVADRLLYLQQALCIDDQVLRELKYTGQPAYFFEWLAMRGGFEHLGWSHLARLYLPLSEISPNLDGKQSRLPKEKWSKYERRIIRVLESLGCWNGRVLGIGLSNTAEAWTDGYSYITINRQYLQDHPPTSVWRAAGLFALLCHELSHDESSAEDSSYHGSAFYQTFHDIVSYNSVAGLAKGHEGGPFRFLQVFCDRLKNVKVEDHNNEMATKENKSKEKKAKVLGINKIKKVEEIELASSVVEIVNRATTRKRLPMGAE